MSLNESNQTLRDVQMALLKAKSEIAALRVLIALRKLSCLAHKAGFNPAQLRIPLG